MPKTLSQIAYKENTKMKKQKISEQSIINELNYECL